MEIEPRCVKMRLPNGRVVDILPHVFIGLSNWLQTDESASEAGGYIVGYEHRGTGNITLEAVSPPFSDDRRGRTWFSMRDRRHKLFLDEAHRRKSYYMGVWHTHPEDVPTPSVIDKKDWLGTIRVDRTACRYAFFIIAGRTEARVWVGDFKTWVISELRVAEPRRI